VIPSLTDHELEHILEAAKAAGATSAGYTLLRLPFEVKDLFREWLTAHYPDRAAHVMSLINQSRGGKDYDSEFGTRMVGTGVFAQLLRKRFELAKRRLAFDGEGRHELRTDLFRPPAANRAQMTLGF
jgi:DNA repair photolyase